MKRFGSATVAIIIRLVLFLLPYILELFAGTRRHGKRIFRVFRRRRRGEDK